MDTEEIYEEEELTFWDHLTELAIRMRRVVIFGFVSTILFLVIPATWNDFVRMLSGDLYNPVSIYVLTRVRDDMLSMVGNELNITLIPVSFATSIELYFQAAIVLGILVTLPYFAYELYMFLEPGLYPHEKRFLKRFVFGFTGAFVLGSLYGYYLIMPITFRILLLFNKFMDIENIFDVRSFYELTFLGVVATGFIFTLPVFLLLAFKFGVLNPDQLVGIRRYLYFGVFFITAVVTPDPTPVSMFLISLPFIVLFEISIWLGRKMGRD